MRSLEELARIKDDDYEIIRMTSNDRSLFKYPPLEKALHVIWPDGIHEWIVDGEFHRVSGPSVEGPDGTFLWISQGKYHCLTGPACVHPFEDAQEEWWIDGEETTEDEWPEKRRIWLEKQRAKEIKELVV